MVILKSIKKLFKERPSTASAGGPVSAVWVDEEEVDHTDIYEASKAYYEKETRKLKQKSKRDSLRSL